MHQIHTIYYISDKSNKVLKKKLKKNKDQRQHRERSHKGQAEIEPEKKRAGGGGEKINETKSIFFLKINKIGKLFSSVQSLSFKPVMSDSL